MPIWIQITAGDGPAECARAVFLAVRQLTAELADAGCHSIILNEAPAPEPQTLQSVLLSAEAVPPLLLSRWQGTVQWICPSPFRPHHRRKNWFIGVEFLPPPENVSFSKDDLRIESMRASGAGGQHVNKTDSAVRITHRPTGMTATASEERSQIKNRHLAMNRLQAQFAMQNQRLQQNAKTKRRELHHQLPRGNPVRTFYGANFTEQLK